MAKRFTVYSALLSSPRGMNEDRQAVHKAVTETNHFLKPDNCQVDVRDWEKDVRPSVGSDGQDVVNRQICNDADFAVILIHDRIGSPTPRAPSGTVEEAEIMLARKEAGENVDVMVFFKKPSIALTAETLKNLQAVLDFRESLERRGVFWKEYTDSLDLEALIRIHLPQCIRDISANDAGTSKEVNVLTESVSPEEGIESEIGIIDLEIEFSDSIKAMTEAIESITGATVELTEGLSTEQIQIEGLQLQPERNPRAIRDSVNQAANCLQRYNSHLEREIPQAREAMAGVTSSLIQMISLSPGELNADRDDLLTLRGTIEESYNNVAGAIQSTKAHREGLAGWPRMTREVNITKRKAVDLLDQLIDTFEGYLARTGEIQAAIDSRLGQASTE